MEILSEINVSEFFKESKNQIKIHFSNDFLGPNSESLHGWWFFKKNLTETLFISESTKIYQDSSQEPYKIVELNKIIQKAKGIFHKKYPEATFPDILIVSASFSDRYIKYNTNNSHQIEISFTTTLSLEAFEFTINHEIGHIVFNLEKNKLIESLKKQRYSPNIDMFPIGIGTLLFANGLMISLTHFNPLFLEILAFLLLSAGLSILTVPFLNFLTFRKRMFNFTKEMFCDFYALCASGISWEKVPRVCLGSISSNHYSHPSLNNRLLNLRENHKEELNYWKNPVIQHPYLFSKLTMGDVVTFWKTL